MAEQDPSPTTTTPSDGAANIEEAYPPSDSLPRSILVDNISPLATSATLEDFFNFCGTIESLKLRKLSNGIQQSVIIFSDEPSRENALVMNKSSILDTQVIITSLPENFNFNKEPPVIDNSAQRSNSMGGMFGGGFSAFGDLFNGVGSVFATEVEKASKAIDKATDTGVLRSAKDQMVLARKKTAEIATDLDNKWKVRENVKNVADVSRERASVVANVVASQTSNLASQVDKNLHISESTTKFAEKARENPTVNTGIRAVTGGFQTLLAQTGLQQQQEQQQQQQQSINDETTNGDSIQTDETHSNVENTTTTTSTATTTTTTNETQNQQAS